MTMRDEQRAREWLLQDHKRANSHILYHNQRRNCPICEGKIDADWSLKDAAAFAASEYERGVREGLEKAVKMAGQPNLASTGAGRCGSKV